MTPSLVVLDRFGQIVKKLECVTPMADYPLVEGQRFSWRFSLRRSVGALAGDPCIEPPVAYFYYGTATAMVCRSAVADSERRVDGTVDFDVRTLTITVQGQAVDLMILRDIILDMINKGKSWGVINNLNPKLPNPSFLQRLRRH